MTRLLAPLTPAAAAPYCEEEFPPFPVRRFTVDEYEELGRSGVLTEDNRVELLDGWIVPKRTHGPPHASTITRIEAALRPAIGSRWIIRIRSAFTTTAGVPEPDVAVVYGPIGRYDAQPLAAADAPLIVEVAETSLDKDRRKARIYAAAGVREYWIVNLVDRQIEVHRRSDTNKNQYLSMETFGEGETLRLELEDVNAVLKVSDLLPPPLDTGSGDKGLGRATRLSNEGTPRATSTLAPANGPAPRSVREISGSTLPAGTETIRQS